MSPLQLSVVIPVLNERANIRPLYDRLTETLAGLVWEVIFVDDDSLDDTAAAVRALAATDPRVRLIHRIGRKGLSSACVEGMMASTAPYVAVMDGDLQHDERVLPEMLRQIEEGGLDLVVASRNVEGGSMGEFAKSRVRLSNLGRWLSYQMTRCPLSDPMSGFFMIHRAFLNRVVRDLSQMGFKILLDLVASSREPVRFAEVPYTFRTRQHGESKLDISVNLDFLLLLVDKKIGDWIPARFVLYTLVGLTGVGVHGAVLAALLYGLRLDWAASNLLATFTAIIWNFFLNNAVTYRDCRLTRWPSLLRGLVVYLAACALGALSNQAIASVLVDRGFHGLLAGAIGMTISSVWNFGIATALAWQIGQHRRRLQQGLQFVAGRNSPARPPSSIW